MEIESKIGEQPELNVTANVAEAKVDDGSNNIDLGSPNKKFKSAESLQKAYEDLEREFTRKSQKLSEIEKSIESDNVNRLTPQYSKDDWHEKIKEFLNENSNAKKYASEISELLYKDKDLACLPNSLDIAYSKVLASKYKSNEELIETEEFLNNYVYNNEKIISNILKKYLENVNANKVPPVILSAKGSSVGFVAPSSPTNLSEAKLLVEKLFNK